jgi:hypothetical protein
MFPSASKIDTLLSYTKVQIPSYIVTKMRKYMNDNKSELPSDPTSLKALIEHPCTTNYLNYVLFENGKALVDCDQNKESPFCFTELALERKTYPNYVEPHAREFPNPKEAAVALSNSKGRYKLNDALSGNYGLLAKVVAKEITANLPENKRYKEDILKSIDDDIGDISMIFMKGYPTVMKEYLVFDGATPIAVKSDYENRQRFQTCNDALPGPKEPEHLDEESGHRYDGRLYSGSKIFNDAGELRKLVNKTCRQAKQYEGDKSLSWQLYAEDIGRKGGLPFPTAADVRAWKAVAGEMRPCDTPVTDEVWKSYLAMINPAVSAEPERLVLPPQRMGTPFIRLRPQTSATATLGLRYGPTGGARKTQKMTRPKARRPLKQHAGKPVTRKYHDRHRKSRRHTRSQKAL